MSTENEGAGTTPATGERPVVPPAPSAPPASDAASTDDFPLPAPDPGAAGGGAGAVGRTAAASPFDAPSARPSPPAAGGQQPAPQQFPPPAAAPAADRTAPGRAAAEPPTAPLPPVPDTLAEGHSGGWGTSPPAPHVHPTAAQTHTGSPMPPHGAPMGGTGGSTSGYGIPTGPMGPAHSNPGGPGPGGPWGMPPAPPPAPKKRRGGLVAIIAAAVLLAGGAGSGIGYVAAEASQNDASTTVPGSSDPGSIDRSPDSVAGIAAKALPSVVTIQAEGDRSSGTGTGFVFDKEGHILTNNHVVAGAADSGELTVVFSDGKKYDAEVVGRAEGYDIAVLKLKDATSAKLTPLPLGDSGKVQVGDATIAIGAPYGLSGTVTTGIVSAKNRPVASSDGEGSNASYMSALQTDASINPGNSGGPLLNGQGAVIGVNSAIQSAGNGLGQSQAGSIGLGFAIPINQAKRVAQTLIATGEPVYPVIGVQVDLRSTTDGAKIMEDTEDGDPPVTPGGPAARAGLQPGDVITELNGRQIDSGPTLISEIWTYEPGEKVKLTYERGGSEKTVEVTLSSREGD